MVRTSAGPAVGILQSRTIFQRTLRKPVVIKGRALHTGELSEIVIEPAPENYGIRFCHDRITAGRGESQFFCAGDSTSSAKINGSRLLCIEHLMSALHGLGITNAHIRCVEGNEVPIRDGSAWDHVSGILDSGWVEQRVPASYLAILDTVRLEDRVGQRTIVAQPWKGFHIDASIHFPPPIGDHSYSIEITPESYRREIAAARTFLQRSIDDVGLSEVRENRLLGLEVSRPDRSQAILYRKSGYVSTLRFSTEAVRHKILDFIGDIYTLGLPIRGRFHLVRPGHGFTLKFCQLLSSLLAEEPPGSLPPNSRGRNRAGSRT
ncbi:MAG: UDP-3-O-acyl-N-acetylglucosamine deacetylase [Acidobacteriota bacterium]